MFLYSAAIYVYTALIYLIAPFHRKAKLWVNGRKNAIRDLQHANMHHCIWFHCASLGEFEQGRPLIEYIRQTHPNAKILLTFFSPSGFEQMKNVQLVDYVMYLPADTLSNAQKFLQAAQPRMAIFVKYDFWLHIISNCQKQQVPLFLISAEFRKSQWLFHPLAKSYLSVLRAFSHIFVQSSESYDLLLDNGFTQVSIAGDTRIDRVINIRNESFSDDVIERFVHDRYVFMVGSSWPQDIKMITKIFHTLPENIAIIIAPHAVDEASINTLLASLKVKCWIYSQPITHEHLAPVLVIDTIGKLSRLYRYSHWAYVGGGFGKGIHNLLEPAVYGIPVAFGPCHHKFPEARWLVDEGQGTIIQSSDDLLDFINRSLPGSLPLPISPSIDNRKGAVDFIYAQIRNYI
ncbi:MAG: 3-deoxy-D-manno-octulosonic acid transferase [Candidatus Competibacteraceae bacterium]|nr:3-deoxy-D-manno-octulosonic acid transferase [Candidatus Competibacteraceae bacterium]